MGRRSDFERIPQDFYRTPLKQASALLPHLPTSCDFVEPCAGDGLLIAHLVGAGHRCVGAFDINPRGDGIRKGNACTIRWKNPGDALFVTNPPWRREILHPIIEHLGAIAPTWLLFDSEWLHTKQSIRLRPFCHKAVSAGRAEWIEGTGMTSKDSCSWYYFDARRTSDFVQFYGAE